MTQHDDHDPRPREDADGGDDELRALWQDAPAPTAVPDISRLLGRERAFRRSIALRNAAEHSAAVLVVITFVRMGIAAEGTTLVRLACALIAAAAVVVSWKIWADGRNLPKPDAAATTAAHLAHHRASLERQIALLGTVPRWYLAPFVPGLVLFLAGVVLESPVASAPLSVQARVVGVMAGACTFVFAGVAWMNRRATRKLQAELAALSDALRGAPFAEARSWYLHAMVPRLALRTTALVLAAVAVVGSAHAGDTWTTPFDGVKHLHRTTTGPTWNVHALVVDLAAPGVKLGATTSAQRKKTPSSFAKLVSAQAAINGDFFSYTDYSTSGLAAGAGVAWSDTKDGTGSGNLVFDKDAANVSIVPEATVLKFDPATMWGVVSGKPLLVKDGTAIASYPSHASLCVRNPRTAVGLSKDGKTLYLAVIDGRQSISVGMTCAELATLMKGLGFEPPRMEGGPRDDQREHTDHVIDQQIEDTVRSLK